MRIAILGAGAWGTALAIHLSQTALRHDVTLWARDPAHLAELAAKRLNRRYLPGFKLPGSLRLAMDLGAALQAVDLVVVATPTAGLRDALRGIVACCASRSAPLPVIWACKGFEANTAKLPHQVVAEEYPASAPCGVLSGPSFANEVAGGLPAALTLASGDAVFAFDTAAALHSSRLRVYSSDDVIGVEVGGAVKNVMAIAAGISDGMGLGHNARAALITRGLAEIARLGVKLGGRMETFMGLTGMGDLILTCTGDLSRNRRVGLMLAKKMPLPEILKKLGHTAEGIYTAPEVLRLARATNTDMPITQAVCDVLYAGVPAITALEDLLNREPKSENG